MASSFFLQVTQSAILFISPLQWASTDVCSSVGATLTSALWLAPSFTSAPVSVVTIHSPRRTTEAFEVSPNAVSTSGSLAGHSGEASCVGATPGDLHCG